MNMNCIYCGTRLKFKDKSKTVECPECGKLTNEETIKFLKKDRSFDSIRYLSFFIGFILLIIGFYPFNNVLIILIGILFMIFGFVLGRITDTLVGKNVKNTFSGEIMACPGCFRTNVPKEDFCIFCGYNLKDVIGYFEGKPKKSSPDLEITKDKLIFYKKEKEIDSVTDNVKFKRIKFSYPINQIKNLKITECKHLLKTHPCVSFDFGKNVSYKISKKDIIDLENIFSSEIFQQARET